MTEDKLPLAELLAKSGDANFLRAVAEAVLQLLMEADVEGLIGAGRYERTGERLNWRNGFRERTLETRLGPMQLLDELPPHVRVVDAAKIPYGRAASQEVINSTLIEEAKAGRFVVRLKGGDPYLFGRGFEELLACAEAGVPVTIVPGVTSAFGVPAVAGVPVTHRGVAHEVVVVSGHVAPDDPRSLVDWPALARLRGTLVLLMGVERIRAFADALLEGRPADTPVAVIQEGTTRSQRIVRTVLSEVADRVVAEEIRPPAIIVFGPVAALGDHLA